MARVLAISGSIRRGSYNTALLRAAAECAADVEFVLWQRLAEVPAYDQDLENLPAPLPSPCSGTRSIERTLS